MERHHPDDRAGDFDAGALADGLRTNGVGDVQFTAFLSPANPGGWIWASASSRNCQRTATTARQRRWGLGPRSSCCTSKRRPWVYGVLVNNIWSVEPRRCAVVQQRADPAVR
jgi:hypothetical protein